MSIFHRIEEYGDNHIEGSYMAISFRTKHRGIWQCRWTATGMGEFNSEPPFESLTASEQEEIKEVSKMVFYCTHGEIPNV